MTRRQIISTLILLAAALLLGACAPASTPASELPTATVADAVPAPVTDPAGSTEEAATGVPAPTETKVVRADQYATDSTTVSLASGRPTLVKFFAFW
jgi:uncharacterized lipoprotein YajG